MAAAASSWHSDKDVQKAVQDFHDICAKNVEMDREKSIHQEIQRIIQAELRIEGLIPPRNLTEFQQPKVDGYYNAGTLKHPEYVGSSYDGVKIGRDGFEFDINLILRGGNTLTATEIRTGYYQLRPKDPYRNPLSGITVNGLISPNLVMQKFTGRLQKIINNTPALKSYDIRLVSHGPATEMDIYIDGNKVYSVDMVPAFEINGMQFVAKPFRDYNTATSDNWRLSYALDEKNKFDGMDRGNFCRKQVLRICKAMRVDSSELKTISSYILKNALFFEDEAHAEPNDWQQDNLALRVLGLWETILKYLDRGQMPVFFNRRMNLLEQIHPVTQENLKYRILRFCRSKDEFLRMLERIKLQYN